MTITTVRWGAQGHQASRRWRQPQGTAKQRNCQWDHAGLGRLQQTFRTQTADLL